MKIVPPATLLTFVLSVALPLAPLHAPAAFAQELASDSDLPPVTPDSDAETQATPDTDADASVDSGPETATEAAADPEPVTLTILDAADVDLDQFLWEQRIVAVLADSPNDPAFQRQMREIEELPQDLVIRDVVVIVDSDRGSDSPLRRRLRPRGFMLAIIEKDGEIKQRRPAPRSVREISAFIDRFPLRRQEMLERMPAGR